MRVGIVGCGFIAWAHALALRALADGGMAPLEFPSVFDLDQARAGELAAALGPSTRVAGDAAALVAATDAVWVCTPTASHLELVRACAEAGRAVFCEKPVGRTLEEAAAVARVVAETGVAHQVGLVLRVAPVFRTLRDVVESGELGRLMTVVFRDDQFLPVQGYYRSTWRADVDVAGGGTLLEHSVHDLDLLQWIGGPVTQVWATVGSFAGYPGIEDLANVVVHYESGATATLTSVWHQVLTRGSTRRVEVFGEHGVAWLEDDATGPLHVEDTEGTRTVPCPHPEWVEALPLGESAGLLGCYVAADRAFVDAVMAGRRPGPGIDEALAAHALVDAAYRSAREGTTVVPVGLSS